jgi:hypothetical protein
MQTWLEYDSVWRTSLSKIETAEGNVSELPDSEKKPWLTPAATIEQVSDVTLAGASPNPDGMGCST